MGLLNGLIAILSIEILFLEVGTLNTEILLAHFFHDNNDNLPSLNQLVHEVSMNTSNKCNKLISQQVSHYVPYVETYHDEFWPLYRMKSRLNYSRRVQTVWTCCKGYIQFGATCVPRCPRSCERGTCKEPDVCICNKGYRMSSEGSCVPECTNGCVNGTCVDPDVCSCNEGYWMDSDGFTCRPVCDAECERNHGYCSEPNMCTCRSGYRRTGNDSSSFVCEPVCDRACTNGHCAAPNVCMCADGYETDENERFTCKPKCEEPCIFGTCTAPGTCTCDHGYKAANASVCEPICSEPCEMGTCVAPESCSCNEGYRHRNDSSKYICEPICEMDCYYGTCAAPGLCTCDKGFVYDETDGTCKPHCPISCGPNANCTSPNRCTCFNGYRFTEPSESIWKKQSNGIVLQKQSICQPVCDFDCINGTCTAPNVCTCNEGHHPLWNLQSLNNSTTRVCAQSFGSACDAISCGDNETCDASGVCVCNNGYAKGANGGCIPFCAQACSNGMCTAPNRCECHDGFAPRNESFCEPICERGCQNGDCVGPNHCVCHDDFVPNISHHSGPECIPACTRNCSGHGECAIRGGHDYRCECHFGWTGWNCDQPILCVLTMTYDHVDVNRITIRNDTDNTIMRAHENAPYCYQCNNSLDNKTLCYVVQSDEGNTTSNIGCLLSTDLPCYTTPRYNASINVTKIVWPFVTIAILLAAGLTAAAYLTYRKRQKKKSSIGTSTNIFIRESCTVEFCCLKMRSINKGDNHEEYTAIVVTIMINSNCNSTDKLDHILLFMTSHKAKISDIHLANNLAPGKKFSYINIYKHI